MNLGTGMKTRTLTILMIVLAGCGRTDTSEVLDQAPEKSDTKPATGPIESGAPPVEHQYPASDAPLIAAALDQIGKTTVYDGAYVGLSYPGGDVPIERGVCTDVVVRALRGAYSMDLQQLVHEDMKANFAKYPRNWGLTRPDKNIDHRRVPNLQMYFKRQGYQLETGSEASDFKQGDLVTCTVGGNRPHIMIVSNKASPSGVPLVIHNIGRGAVEEDRLFDFSITGQYRVKNP